MRPGGCTSCTEREGGMFTCTKCRTVVCKQCVLARLKAVPDDFSQFSYLCSSCQCVASVMWAP